jgi:hypothetical protein
MDSGSWIRKLREERFLKPTGLERLSRAIAEATGNPEFYLAHGSLHDIEAGGVPSIHKLFSLSCFLRIPYDDLLRVFGVNLQDAAQFVPPSDVSETALIPTGPWENRPFPFRLKFSPQFAHDETTLLGPNPREWPGFPVGAFNLDAQRFRYALIGLKDDTMGELLPPGSLVEVDTEQNVPQMFGWTALHSRRLPFVARKRSHCLLVSTGARGIDARAASDVQATDSNLQEPARGNGDRKDCRSLDLFRGDKAKRNSGGAVIDIVRRENHRQRLPRCRSELRRVWASAVVIPTHLGPRSP